MSRFVHDSCSPLDAGRVQRRDPSPGLIWSSLSVAPRGSGIRVTVTLEGQPAAFRPPGRRAGWRYERLGFVLAGLTAAVTAGVQGSGKFEKAPGAAVLVAVRRGRHLGRSDGIGETALNRGGGRPEVG